MTSDLGTANVGTATSGSVNPATPETSGIRILSTLAVMGAMRELTPLCEAANRISIAAEFAPTVALLDRLRAHEAADIAILTAQGIEDLTIEGIIRPGSRTTSRCRASALR